MNCSESQLQAAESNPSGGWRDERGGEELLIHSEQGVDSSTPPLLLLPSAPLSLPLADSSSLVRSLSLFSQPCHLSPSLTPACHFHFLLPPPSQLSHFSDCTCFVNSKTHTDSHCCCRQCHTLSLLLLSPTDNENLSNAVILLMSLTGHKKE